ncbi:hypothetical protein OG864_17105 [Streptomyces sp. NBC_00124]|uniref:hypothetical protein n=1 Tax=Streptomyces sp. NBC_00124 TaxID=2975662 RepID=UPI002255A601|nr:hypothetical protein [Streptomyces sp. NBC_00124]MCX5360423.1 hypothetical protein [Streptomyces sp. NBC_00124]
MPALSPRPRRLALALAAITALTLGTVSASAATASESTDDPPRARPGLAIGYEPTENAPDDLNEANDEFAACMRGEGQTVFPDFHAEKGEDGGIRLQVRMKLEKGDEPTLLGKAYRKATKKCAPILKEAGLTLPKTPDTIRPPDLPGHPGGDELPGLRKHIEKA